MKTGRIAGIIAAVLLVIGAASLVWLSQASLMPPVQKMEQAIPDDHIPR